MTYPLEAAWADLGDLPEQEESLEAVVRGEDRTYSGLRDVDGVLSLAKIKLQIALLLLKHLAGEHTERARELFSAAQQRAQAAVRLLDELASTNLSVDQEELVKQDAVFLEAKELFQELLLKGGGAFFDDRMEDRRHAKILAAAVTEALGKYYRPDDNYVRFFKTEDLPPFLRRVTGFLFPILAAERQKDPPYGIPEGEEKLYEAEKIKLPLSQAVHYIEHQLLPRLREQLAENPGDPGIQQQIAALEKRAEDYRRLRFFPRSTPVLLEKDFYTNGLSAYTADGELLVTINVPTQQRSGTNLTRIQELVQAEVVRRVAGKGICPEIDEEYRRLKKIESGMRGSSLTPSFKIRTARGFRVLKGRYPILKSLEDRRTFQELLEHYRTRGGKVTRRFLIDSFLNRTIHPGRLLE